MKLDSLHLKNFRCFDELTMDIDEKLTVIVAINGAGKTTILDAIRIALWPYLTSFDLAHTGFSDPANSITIDDVTKAVIDENTITRLLPSKVIAKGNILGVTEWSRFREQESPRSKTLDDVHAKNLRKYASDIQTQLRTPSSTSEVSLPILGYYGTGRLWSNKKEKKKPLTQTEIESSLMRTYGYKNCLDPASSYRAFETWFIKTLNSHTAEIAKIIKKEGTLYDFRETKFSDRITVIRHALDTVLESTDYQHIDLDIDSQKLSMWNRETGVELKIDQLSDGVRNMIGMVADIAYRCYQLNSHLGVSAALETQGIVMIDEVDMHLHPQWQQLIIEQLQKTFPKIQFIVTTHSPQVLTTVSGKHIRVLKKTNGRWSAEWPEISPYGRESGDALAYVMETATKPPLSILDKIHQYEQFVRKGQENIDSVQALKQELDQAGVQIPEADITLWRFLAQRGIATHD